MNPSLEPPPMMPERQQCSIRRRSPVSYVLAALFLAFGVFLAVKAAKTSDVLTGVIAVGISVYAVMRAYGKAG